MRLRINKNQEISNTTMFAKKRNSGMSRSNIGVSSTDTHRSSVRYEPVSGERSAFTPTKLNPLVHNHLKLLGSRSDSLSQTGESESDPDELDDNICDFTHTGSVLSTRETDKSLSAQRRMSSPVLDQRTPQLGSQFVSRRGSSYLLTGNSANLHTPKQAATHNHISRMGTGVSPQSMLIAQSSNHTPLSKYDQQHNNSKSIMTSRVSGSLPLDKSQYNPVVTTTLKPTYEVDETRMWSFSRGLDGDSRATYGGGYTPGIPTSSLSHGAAVPAGQANNTATRFMNKKPTFVTGRHHHRREPRQYEGSLKSFRQDCWRRCTWKCAALMFLVFTLLLLALVAYFLVLTMNVSVYNGEIPTTTQCITSSIPNLQLPPDSDKNEDQPTELQLKRNTVMQISPFKFKRMSIYVEEPTHFKFNCSVSPAAQMAIYGRRGLDPSHTQFDFFEKIDGNVLPSARMTSQSSLATLTSTAKSTSRKRRSVTSDPLVNTGFVQYLEPGVWHLAVFNDGKNEQVFQVVTTVSKGLSQCLNKCSGNGDCGNGVCKCFPGFQGSDCSQVSCSVTCRGNGIYAHGKCVCFSGWKGVECATPSDKCIDPLCSGRGNCDQNGDCVCRSGYRGEICESVDCLDPTCSGHGICSSGQCYCNRGWKGTLCAVEDDTCSINCNGKGNFDEMSQSCICESGWGGLDCEIATCRPTCDPKHGVCADGLCRCDDGWTGDVCDTRQCHEKCLAHGMCSSGTCICKPGWNGDLCTFDGCPNSCSGKGNCAIDSNGDYYCACITGWKGVQCNIQVETQCTDGRDNDQDTLTDCQDPDCCSHRACGHSSQCRGGLDPVSEITRIHGHTPISSTSSFLERVKFLMHRNGVQKNVATNKIVARQASVVRGRVITFDGSPLIGVEVKIESTPKYGSTKTRADGWYDMIVNGGGSLTLIFHRASFIVARATVSVTWNEFVIVEPTIMLTPSQPANPFGLASFSKCDISLLPLPTSSILISSVRAYTGAACTERGSLITEIQAIRHSIPLPTTQSSLVYLSSRSSGYKSTILVSLIKGEKLANLRQVHLKVIIQGTIFEKKFEPISEFEYTFQWDRNDVYGQKVYGKVYAKVLVGYEYESCNDIVWKTHVVETIGHDPEQRESIGGWTLDIHNRYFPDKGTVYLGTGGQMDLNEQPPTISTVMGNGMSRHGSCERCNGPAIKSKVMSPVALASDANGNVYIGDHNFIRKLDTTGNATNLYTTRNPPAKYYMTVSPLSHGVLYFSHPTERRIYKLLDMNMSRGRTSRDWASNAVVVVGSGEACYPLQQDKCGDGGPAISARLSVPKGLAIDKTGRLYFVDGTRIRTVDPDTGMVETFVDSLISDSRPLLCEGSMSLKQLELNFPTDLAISQIDGNLYVLDEDVVIKIDIANEQVTLVAGVPVQCARVAKKHPDNRDSRKVNLVSPTAITISPKDGALYISETDQKSTHRVQRVNPYSFRISTIAGRDSNCDCAVQDCDCFEGDGGFARNALLHNPISITSTPDGSIYIGDQLNLRIRKIHQSLPKLTDRLQYNVANPDTNQMYVFDALGRHLETKNVVTGSMLYTFAYNRNNYLTSLTDVNGNRLQIDFDSTSKPYQMILPSQQSIRLIINRDGYLEDILQGNVALASLTYQGDSGIIRSIVVGRYASSFYNYDAYGRLVTATSSTGMMTSFHSRSNLTAMTVTMVSTATSSGDAVSSNVGLGRRDVIITTEPGYLCDVITTQEGAMTTTYKRWTDNSISVFYLDKSEVKFETKPHPVLGLTAPFLAKRTIRLPSDSIENKIEWRTRKEHEAGLGESQFLLGRRMRVNDRNILSLDYSQGMKMEKIYDDHTKFMLRIEYNDRGFPTLWMPSKGITPVNVTYDKVGHPTTWQRGAHSETIGYDVNGNLQSVRNSDGTMWNYSNMNKETKLSLPGTASQFTFKYNSDNSLQKITLPSGLSYSIDRRIGIGFIRTRVTGPNGISSYVLDQNDQGEPLSILYTGDARKVIFRYDGHGHMTEVLHDSAITRMVRDPQSGEITSVSANDCMLRFHRNGPLVQKHTVTSSSNGGVVAVFEYEYNMNLHLSEISVKVNDTKLQSESLTYNDVSGKLTTFGQYMVYDYANMYVVGTQAATLTKQSDNNGRIVGTEIEVYSAIVFNLIAAYDTSGRLASQTHTVGMYANSTKIRYTYTRDGALDTVSTDGRTNWKYVYDEDGKLVRAQEEGTWTSLRYDQQGRLSALGDLQYEFDADGFLRHRGNEIFEYNSMGHLTKAYRLDNLYEINYGYDGFGRLSTRVDVLRREVLRYLYADLSQPNRLTHFYNATSGHVTSFRYDAEGYLFALERSDGASWSVACDHAGTPLAVMDSAGFVAKRITYSPFGQVLFDSTPSLVIVVGFRGGIYDVTTGLVRFSDRAAILPFTHPGIAPPKPNAPLESREKSTGRIESGVDYDALTGQLTSSSINLLSKVRGQAAPFRAYQVIDPINLIPVYLHMTDTTSWLGALGFKLQNVAPDPQIASRQKDKSSIECQLSHHLSTYMNLHTVTPSRLVPTRSEIQVQNTVPGGTMFAQGLVIVLDRGTVSTKIVNTATDDVKRLSGIINGADVIVGKNTDSPSAAMSLTIEGKPTVFLYKPLDSLSKDQRTLHLLEGHDRVLDGGYDKDFAKSGIQIVLSLTDNTIKAESGYSVVSISYVDPDANNIAYVVQQKNDDIMSAAFERAAEKAWSRERTLVRTGLRTNWSSRESKEILEFGKLGGYDVIPTFDPERYPDLADSGRNVQFIKKS